MTEVNRLSVGFHRIGVVLAAFPVASALFWICIYIWGGGSDKQTPMAFALISAVAAVVVYALARGIGWIAEGFRG